VTPTRRPVVRSGTLGDVLRHVFTLASALSLVVCLGLAVLWLDSRDASEELTYSRWREVNGVSRLWAAGVGACRGRVWVDLMSADLYAPSSVALFQKYNPSGFHREKFTGQAFTEFFSEGPWVSARTVANGNSHARVVDREAMAPAWLVIAFTLTLPVGWLLAYRRSRQLIRSGHCRSCGYNTGNASGTCPECGAAVVRATPARPPGA
jgi:hypothetical protein